MRVHITFALFLVWIGVSAYFQGGSDTAIKNLAFIVALFTCVLAHEFGHIQVARRFGIKTSEVTLLPIGGVASLERIPDKPLQETAVALAGPGVNVVIAVLLLTIGGAYIPDVIERIDNPNISLIARLAVANLFLALFNFLPAFPMDGGRVLHAVLALRIGPQRATLLAARIGQGFAFLLGFVGLFGNPILVFIAIFIYVAAAGEAQESTFRAAVRDLSIVDGMETQFSTLTPDATIGEAIDILLASQREIRVVENRNVPVGLLSRDLLIATLKQHPQQTRVSMIMSAPMRTTSVANSLADALGEFAGGDGAAVGVVDAMGALVGLLTRENLLEIMMISEVQPDWKLSRK